MFGQVPNLVLEVFDGTFAICRLAPGESPTWPTGQFVSITRTADELSIVCEQEAMPMEVKSDRGWRCVRVVGKLDLALVGVLASLLVPLAQANVGVFVVSTFDTDCLLVKEVELQKAMEAWRAVGFEIEG
jgi:hypothetical protein